MSAAAGGPSSWELLEVRTPQEVAGLAGEPAGFAVLEHDPRWLAALLDDAGQSLWLARRGGRCEFALFAHDVGLALDLGELTLGRIPVRRHVLAGGFRGGETRAADLAALLAAMAPRLGPRGVVFLQGVGADEPLRGALEDPRVRGAYLRLRHGPEYRRCRIELPGSFDAYLGQLRGSVRKDLARAARRFRARYGGAIRLQVLTTTAELDEALPALARLSQRTYQGRLLGQAVGGVVERQLRQSMALGIGRVDLLWVGPQLASYQLAYLHAGTLHATHAGYEPDLAADAPGIAHLWFILEGLCSPGADCRVFDFMYGESPYKSRLSNRFHPEAHYYLLPRTPRGRATWLALRATAVLGETAGGLLRRLGLKDALKRVMRRLPGAAPSGGD